LTCWGWEKVCHIWIWCLATGLHAKQTCGFFVLFVFVMCLMYPMLPVPLDCPFLIAPPVFSNNYLLIKRCSRLRTNGLSLFNHKVLRYFPTTEGGIWVFPYKNGSLFRENCGITPLFVVFRWLYDHFYTDIWNSMPWH